MIRCRRFRIELAADGRDGGCAVSVEPVEYLGRPEFKEWARLCRAAFMDLEHTYRRWRMVRRFSDEADASRFAAQLAYSLGEAFWMRLGVAAPCRVPVEDTKGEIHE
jgi:hypothetical protein